MEEEAEIGVEHASAEPETVAEVVEELTQEEERNDDRWETIQNELAAIKSEQTALRELLTVQKAPEPEPESASDETPSLESPEQPLSVENDRPADPPKRKRSPWSMRGH